MSAIHKMRDVPCDLKYLHLRCREVDGCWLWAGATKHGNLPRIWFRRADMDGEVRDFEVFVRHLVLWIANGERPPADNFNVIRPTCGNPLCIKPEHLRMFTKSEANSDISRMGYLRNRIKVAEARRRNGKLTDVQVREIRDSDTPGKHIAPLYGITQQYVSLIRSGKSRREYVNPFAGLGA